MRSSTTLSVRLSVCLRIFLLRDTRVSTSARPFRSRSPRLLRACETNSGQKRKKKEQRKIRKSAARACEIREVVRTVTNAENL